MITIEGLTQKQKVFADVIWACETNQEVENFIRSLPTKDQLDARTVTEMMILAFTDQIQSTDLAKEALAQFMK